MKKLWFIGILSLFVALLCPVAAFADVETDTTIASGSCGDHVLYSYDSGGTLTISLDLSQSSNQSSATSNAVTYAMTDYASAQEVPWYSFRASILKVDFDAGITHIGSHCFEGMGALTYIDLPNSVTSLGDYALAKCKRLTKTVLPPYLEAEGVGSHCFENAGGAFVAYDANTAKAVVDVGLAASCDEASLSDNFDSSGKRRIDGTMVDLVRDDDVEYNSWPHYLVPTLSYGGVPLVEGVDYTLENTGPHINIGEYVIFVRGMGRYSGTRTTLFTISIPEDAKYDLLAYGVYAQLESSKLNYTGEPVYPKYVVYLPGYGAARPADNYRIEFSGPSIEPGTYTIKIYGCGLFYNGFSFTYEIVESGGSEGTGDSSGLKAYEEYLASIDNADDANSGGESGDASNNTSNDNGGSSANSGSNSGDANNANGTGDDSANASNTNSSNDASEDDANSDSEVVDVVDKPLAVKTVSMSGKLAKATISFATHASTGKRLVPKLTLPGFESLVLGKDYTVSYKGNLTSVGTHYIIVTCKGTYTGSRTFTLTITPVKAALKSFAKQKKTGYLVAKWKKASGQYAGYEVEVATSKSFSHVKKVKVAKGKTSLSFGGAKKGKRYYIRIRVRTVSGGKTYYGAWSTVKRVTA